MPDLDARPSSATTAGGGGSVLRIAFVVIGLVLVLAVIAQLTAGSDPDTDPGTRAATEQSAGADAGADAGAQGAAPGPREGELDVVRRDPADPMAMGDPDAPVVLMQWTDYRCPFCAVFSRDVLPQIVEEYVDAGVVRFEVNDVAFFGEESETAAVAARAAGEQGRYHEFMTAVYASAPESGHPDLPRDELVGFAEEAGVADIDRFTADLDNESLREAVRASQATAQSYGISSVPFFVIGDTSLSGARPIEHFRTFIDTAVAEADQPASTQ